jgi:hypothetical protein
MAELETLLISLARDVVPFVRCASGLQLRGYQEAVARAIVRSVLGGQGHSFVVIFPRQSGKNELQAQLQAYLLTLFSGQRAEMVQVCPTWKPQAANAMSRLEAVLNGSLLLRDRWEKQHGHVYQIGQARLAFLSGSPTANIVGATANLLLSVDEAQDIQTDKFDKEIAPMAASTHATRVFWGTAWTSNTLLAREEGAALAQQKLDGIRRAWRLDCADVAREVPAYGAFVAEQVERLGRNHPMVRTQYFSEDIDAEGGLFSAQRLALLRGLHPPQLIPQPGGIYVMTLDLAGEDEAGGTGALQISPAARDATALTIARVDLAALNEIESHLPTYQIVHRQLWVGARHTDLYGQIVRMAADWGVRYLACDATGVGAGLTAFLSQALGPKVIPFVFSSKSKSDLGWSFLALIDSGRLKDHAPGEADTAGLDGLQALFFSQLTHCQYEILPGPEKRIRWGVPDGTRDLHSGELVHDDLVISAALLSLLDRQAWSQPGRTAIVHASDPLEDMHGY